MGMLPAFVTYLTSALRAQNQLARSPNRSTPSTAHTLERPGARYRKSALLTRRQLMYDSSWSDREAHSGRWQRARCRTQNSVPQGGSLPQGGGLTEGATRQGGSAYLAHAAGRVIDRTSPKQNACVPREPGAQPERLQGDRLCEVAHTALH